MCLFANDVNAVKADEDIVCYKAVTIEDTNPPQFRAMFYSHFRYELNRLYNEPDFKRYTPDYTVTYGFHSYAHESTARNSCETTNTNDVVVKCVIPKGSWYFKGEGPFSYCSDRIRLVAWKYRDEYEWHTCAKKKLFEKLKTLFKK